MSKKISKKVSISERNRMRRRTKIRSKIFGTPARPRISIFRSNTGIYAQLIDDEAKVTLAAASTMSKELKGKIKNNIDGAKTVGELLAKLAVKKSVKEAVFDRSGYLYHGKVKALADGIRAGGLKV